MVSFYSFSYAIFWELKELENSWAQHNVRGNLQFLEFDIFYCECNVGITSECLYHYHQLDYQSMVKELQ